MRTHKPTQSGIKAKILDSAENLGLRRKSQIKAKIPALSKITRIQNYYIVQYDCKFVSMNCLSNELPFAIHQIGFLDLQFIRQVLNSDAAAGAAASAAASVSITAFAVVASEAAAEAAEAAAPAAASEFKTYLMNCKSKKPI